MSLQQDRGLTDLNHFDISLSTYYSGTYYGGAVTQSGPRPLTPEDAMSCGFEPAVARRQLQGFTGVFLLVTPAVTRMTDRSGPQVRSLYCPILSHPVHVSKPSKSGHFALTNDIWFGH